MATTTPNFGWAVPTSSDLVKNGATAIETLGDAIDASMVDLKGGTTGQVLSKATNTDMDFAWITPSAGSSGSSNVAGKNAILNSDFNIWQRGTSIAATGGSGVYTADRWSAYNASYTVSQQSTSDTTNLPFINKCARVQRNSGATATNGVNFVQPLESVNSKPFIGKVATLSFYARAGANYSSASNALLVFLLGGTGTDQNPNNTYTGSSNVISQTATLTTTWQRFTYTSSTIATTVNELAVQFTSLGVGTAGANDYFEVTGVQLEIASSATAYSPNAATFQGELAACQRYYVRTTSTAVFANYAMGIGQAGTTALLQMQVPEMRIAPTVVDFANLCVTDLAVNTTVTALTLDSNNTTPRIAFLNATVASGLTVQRPYILRNNNSSAGYVGIGAEL